MIHFLTESAAHFRRGLIQRGGAVGSVRPSALADGERSYRLLEDVTRAPVTVVGSILPAPESLFDVMAYFRLLRENRARFPNLCIPYLGYARQDIQTPGEVALGVMIGECLRNLNAAAIHVIDPHSPRATDALGPGVTISSALPFIAETLRKGEPFDVVVAPDRGATARAQALASMLSPEMGVAVIDKIRPKPNTATAQQLEGDVKHKRVILIDDMIDTGGTVIAAVKRLKDAGAGDILVAATHGVFSGHALEKILKLPIEGVIVTNTLPQPREDRLHVLDLSTLILHQSDQKI